MLLFHITQEQSPFIYFDSLADCIEMNPFHFNTFHGIVFIKLFKMQYSRGIVPRTFNAIAVNTNSNEVCKNMNRYPCNIPIGISTAEKSFLIEDKYTVSDKQLLSSIEFLTYQHSYFFFDCVFRSKHAIYCKF